MPLTIQSESPPLRRDECGGYLVGDTRVSLETVIEAFEDGAAPHVIVEHYDALRLEDVYAVISYYLRHRSEVQQYMAERERAADEMRKRIEEIQGDQSELRARLLARQKGR